MKKEYLSSHLYFLPILTPLPHHTFCTFRFSGLADALPVIILYAMDFCDNYLTYFSVVPSSWRK